MQRPRRIYRARGEKWKWKCLWRSGLKFIRWNCERSILCLRLLCFVSAKSFVVVILRVGCMLSLPTEALSKWAVTIFDSQTHWKKEWHERGTNSRQHVSVCKGRYYAEILMSFGVLSGSWRHNEATATWRPNAAHLETTRCAQSQPWEHSRGIVL